ncbi:glycoside hydrolase family 32 protein [Paenibacillus cymbidii]|uniref:glycoside hydrolase family 32 protein n=1 Tax=Paenibacillus cymbidii TaxID=1639034 RepID=UPI00108053C1|nr:glycoside hydrolase family 32 protein [Paenibacillus cymbidii]
MTVNLPRLHYHGDDWMNDPIPFYWNGEYHLFYQYRMPAKHWGHARSTDLLHWETLPVAIAPDVEGLDDDGCWTGCCLYAEGKFHLFYAGVQKGTRRQTICHAESDDLIVWRKNPCNPIVRAAAPYAEAGAWRDPFIWHEEGRWHMLLSADMPDRPHAAKGCVAYLHAPNLFDWTLGDPIYVPDGMVQCECPDVFPLGDTGKYVLLMSGGHTFVRYGDSMRGPFHRPAERPLFDDDKCYAVKTLEDGSGRRLAWGFLVEPWGWAHAERPVEQSWSSNLSFPRLLSADANGELAVSWPAELDRLRAQELGVALRPVLGRWTNAEGKRQQGAELAGGGGAPDAATGGFAVAVAKDAEYAYASFPAEWSSHQLELQATIRLNGATRAGIAIRCTHDLREITGVFIDAATRSIVIEELSNGFDSIRPGKRKARSRLALPSWSPDGWWHLQVRLDGPIVEVCVNRSTIVSGTAYADSELATEAGLFAVGGGAEFAARRAWRLALPQDSGTGE